jgi:hypothetical protein
MQNRYQTFSTKWQEKIVSCGLVDGGLTEEKCLSSKTFWKRRLDPGLFSQCYLDASKKRTV